MTKEVTTVYDFDGTQSQELNSAVTQIFVLDEEIKRLQAKKTELANKVKLACADMRKNDNIGKFTAGTCSWTIGYTPSGFKFSSTDLKKKYPHIYDECKTTPCDEVFSISQVKVNKAITCDIRTNALR